MDRKKAFNPSSAGFLVHGRAVTKYESGCMRAILAKKHGARTPFPVVLGIIGDKFEQLCLQWLIRNHADKAIFVERPIKQICVGKENSYFSGREDFTLVDADGKTTIVECKSMISTKGRREKIRKRQLEPSQLAQLVSYMIQEEVTDGLMMLGYYERDMDTMEPWCPNAFRDMGTKDANFAVVPVSIRDDGKILVDGRAYQYDVLQCLQHRNMVLDVLDKEIVGDRPLNADLEYGSPCTFCPFNKPCSDYDMSGIGGKQQTAEEFIKNCQKAAKEKKQDGPVLNIPKRRRK